MKTPEPCPPKRGLKRLIRQWFIVLALVLFAYGAWREYDFRTAVKEARDLGWMWTTGSPFDAIREDWKAAIRIETWFSWHRELTIPRTGELEKHGDLLLRINPQFLDLVDGDVPVDFALLKRVSALRNLWLTRQTALTNVDALKEFKRLEVLGLSGCKKLANIEGLAELRGLRVLFLNGCTSLKDFGILKGLNNLQELNLIGCRLLSSEGVADLGNALPNTSINEP